MESSENKFTRELSNILEYNEEFFKSLSDYTLTKEELSNFILSIGEQCFDESGELLNDIKEITKDNIDFTPEKIKSSIKKITDLLISDHSEDLEIADKLSFRIQVNLANNIKSLFEENNINKLKYVPFYILKDIMSPRFYLYDKYIIDFNDEKILNRSANYFNKIVSSKPSVNSSSMGNLDDIPIDNNIIIYLEDIPIDNSIILLAGERGEREEEKKEGEREEEKKEEGEYVLPADELRFSSSAESMRNRGLPPINPNVNFIVEELNNEDNNEENNEENKNNEINLDSLNPRGRIPWAPRY